MVLPIVGGRWFEEASPLIVLSRTSTFPGQPSPPAECVPSDVDWRAAFMQHYPDSRGFYMLSAVGFDAPATRAMVYAAQICGLGCGAGRYFFLEKKAGVWQVTLPGGLSNDCAWTAKTSEPDKR